MTTAPLPVQLVCLDMAGTTVHDDGAVLAAFHHALDTIGIPTGTPNTTPPSPTPSTPWASPRSRSSAS